MIDDSDHFGQSNLREQAWPLISPGCIYCYARPTHAYWDLSPGLDFETRLIYKPNAPELLREELSRPGYRCQTIALGTNTDPYQPIEKRFRLTRQVLEVMYEFRQPVSIVTKSALILSDLDILSAMAKEQLAAVFISVTTLDDELKRRLEPRAASGQKRLNVIKALAEAGVPVGVLAAPVIPKINDAELENILAESRESGARSAAYILLRLPREVAPLFYQWLQEHYPLRAQAVKSLLEACRGGNRYQGDYGTRMVGSGVFAQLLSRRFQRACQQLGLALGESMPLDHRRFVVPGSQMALF